MKVGNLGEEILKGLEPGTGSNGVVLKAVLMPVKFAFTDDQREALFVALHRMRRELGLFDCRFRDLFNVGDHVVRGTPRGVQAS